MTTDSKDRSAEPDEHGEGFAEGQAHPGTPGHDHEQGRFSEGQEQLPSRAAEQAGEGFAEGQAHPESYVEEHSQGRFSEGEKRK